MNTEDCFYVGYVSKTFGYKGELVVYLDVDNPENYEKMESVFLHLQGKLIPFFLSKMELRSNLPEAIVAFHDVNTIEKAKSLIGAEIYLPEQLLPQLDGDDFYFHELAGYQVIDDVKGQLGVVVTVLDFPGNPVIQIQVATKELLIPARDEFIKHLDRGNKILFIHNAGDLIDFYLNV